jgi:hypothetical protein
MDVEVKYDIHLLADLPYFIINHQRVEFADLAKIQNPLLLHHLT